MNLASAMNTAVGHSCYCYIVMIFLQMLQLKDRMARRSSSPLNGLEILFKPCGLALSQSLERQRILRSNRIKIGSLTSAKMCETYP